MDELYLPANLNSSLGRASHQKDVIEKTRLSSEMQDYIVNFINEAPATLLSKPTLTLPPSYHPLDDRHPLTHYFISSSHNTYLLSHQLLGTSSVSAYTHVLLRGCACVEIDLWWRGSKAKKAKEEGRGEEEGLRVTHGWTLSSEVGFEDVCKAIGDAVKVLESRHHAGSGGGQAKADFPPILISLENHVPAQHQHHIITVLKRTLSPWLVLGKIEDLEDDDPLPDFNAEEGHGLPKGVKLKDLRGRVVVMVEYYPQDPVGNVVHAAKNAGDAAQEGQDRLWTALKERKKRRSSSSSSSSSSSDSEDDLDAYEIPESGSFSQIDLAELSSESSDEEASHAKSTAATGSQEEERPSRFRSRIWPIRRRHKGGEDGTKNKKKSPPKITDTLAELGYYCRSMKPGEGWWGRFIHDPKHVLINISESAHEPLLLMPPVPLPSSPHTHTSLSESLSRLSLHRSPSPAPKVPPPNTPLTPLQSHSLTHLRRVYPRGTRIRSGNMLPSKYWRSGTQVVGVNWQRMDAGGEIGVGMFVVGEGGDSQSYIEEKAEEKKEGSVGIESLADTAPVSKSEEGISYVLKPSWLRGGEDRRELKKLRITIWGGCGISPPKGYEIKPEENKEGKEFGLYIKAELYCANVERHRWPHLHLHDSSHGTEDPATVTKGPNPDQILTFQSPTLKTREASPSTGCDFSFSSSEKSKDECQWEIEYLEDELAFLRIGIYRDERWGKDDLLGWFCARTVYLPTDLQASSGSNGGWRIVKVMDEEGRFRGGVLLVRFEF